MQVSIGVTRPDSSHHNDCSVRALANGLGYAYEDAAAICKQNGRKRKNCGMTDTNVYRMLNGMPDKLRPIFQVFACDAIPLRLSLMTLNPVKTYLVCILHPGHIFAVRHGVILDGQSDFYRWSMHYLRAKTIAVWEVFEPEQLTFNFEGSTTC